MTWPNNKGYSGGEGRASDYAHWLKQVGGDEPPPRVSVQCWATVRECLVRSTISDGGGR